MEHTAETTSPKFESVLKLIQNDRFVITLINEKSIVGKMITYDHSFLVLKTEDRRMVKVVEEVIIIPFSSIIMIKPITD